jgi:hypothetical protein
VGRFSVRWIHKNPNVAADLKLTIALTRPAFSTGSGS